MTENKNMMIFSSDWYGKGSFRMMPTNKDCPFVEVIFDPSTKILAVLSNTVKDKPQMVPKLNSKGQTVTVKNADGVAGLAEERLIMETYHEYYIDNESDIREFIKRFAENPKHSATEILNTIFKEEDKK